MKQLLLLLISIIMLACCTSKSGQYGATKQPFGISTYVPIPHDTYLVKNMCYDNIDTVKADYYVVVNESDLGVVYFRVDNPNTGIYNTVATYTYSTNCLLTITQLIK